jgi:hypothetical protein
MGMVGGTLFTGACYLSVWSLYRLRAALRPILDPGLSRARPFLTAAAAAYAVGMLTLSRTYVVPTYLMLGLACVYPPMAVAHPPLPGLRLDGRLVVRLVAVSVGVVAALYVFVKTFVHWG